jgi:hypothetical protein
MNNPYEHTVTLADLEELVIFAAVAAGFFYLAWWGF